MEQVHEATLSVPGAEVAVKVFRWSLLADDETPIGLYQRLSTHASFILESAEKNVRLGRYSFIGGCPLAEVSARDNHVDLYLHDFPAKPSTKPSRGSGTRIRFTKSDVLAVLEDVLGEAARGASEASSEKGFFGGFCGYLGFDYVKRSEPRAARCAPDPREEYAYFMMPSYVIRFDHFAQRVDVFVAVMAAAKERENEVRDRARSAYRALLSTLAEVHAPRLAHPESLEPTGFGRLRSSVSRTAFEDAVRRAQEYIRAGDIFQVVLSQRFSCPRLVSPLSLYRMLRLSNPSPYMFLYNAPSFTLVGASPEPMLRVTARRAMQRPIAGTRRRGATHAEDERIAAELLADEKERAEHIMLVDLARNDLGRVCKPGSVELTQNMTIERYSHVMHIVSEVEGELAAGETALSALRASFPAGTVSGAPKIRAIQIIDELEHVRRGPYAGAFGYVNLAGDLDTCLLIRTAVVKDSTIEVQAGAGIVADSIPEREYEETVSKAQGIVSLLEGGAFAHAAHAR